MNFLAVALGGAIGAAGRYAISLMPVKAEFPVLTLITFTTFSTFSLEALTLLEKKAYLAGSCYIILSVVFCLAGVICGRRLAMLLH